MKVTRAAVAFFSFQSALSRNGHEIVSCPGPLRDSLSHLYLFPLDSSKYYQPSSHPKLAEGLREKSSSWENNLIAQANLQPFHFLQLLLAAAFDPFLQL